MAEPVNANDSDSQLTLSEPLSALKERALRAGLSADAVLSWIEDEVVLRVDYPEGRGSRSVEYSEANVDALQDVDLGAVRFLPDLLGFSDSGSGTIEAQVRLRAALLRNIPGFESLDDAPDRESEDDQFGFRLPNRWRLAVDKDGVELELSPASDQFVAVRALSARNRSTTLKVRGRTHASSSETLEFLTALSDAFFFELDVRYGVTAELMTSPGRPTMRRRGVRTAIEFPQNRYHAQPATLYRYGRSAQGLPLLSFLAFYQVLEFFFPIFTQEEVSNRVRQKLRSPRFNSEDETSIQALIAIIRPSVKFGVSEKEQLRATIRRCLETEAIKQFVTSSEPTQEHFCQRRQSITGLSALTLDGSGQDLRDQVADRIYEIRCRIVHTKSDGGDTGVELLLPTGPEARSLAPDIELARIAAEEALVAGSRPLDLL